MTTFYDALKSRYLNRYKNLSSKKKAAEELDFRDLLSTKIAYASIRESTPFLGIKANDYLKASFHEVLRYTTRGMIAYNDFCETAQTNSRSWRFVTLYYSLYFFVISFGRMAGRSIIFLNSDEARELTALIRTLANSEISLSSGNYLITLDKPNEPLAIRDNIEVSIIKLNKGSHENAWHEFKSLLDIWKIEFSDKSLATVTGMNNCLSRSPAIFSETRNRINYRGDIALHEIDELILPLGSDKRSMSIEALEREIISNVHPIISQNDVMQAAHSFSSFFYVCHRNAMLDLADTQPHPGTHYIKQIKRLYCD
jgi:hypothetical protein